MTTAIMKKGNGSSSVPATFGGLVDQIFQNNLSRFFDDDFWGASALNRYNSVPVNLKETDKTYEMEVIAPGLKKDDFRLNVSNDMLTISFEHKEQNKEENSNEGWLRKEYRLHSFTRSFSMDDSVDVNKITAKYSDGILYLTLPKKENAQRISRTIEIK